MCRFVRPSEPLVDTLNTTCRSRYAKYNELGEDEEDTETEDDVSESSLGAAEPADVPAAGKYVLLLRDKVDCKNLSASHADALNCCVNWTELQAFCFM